MGVVQGKLKPALTSQRRENQCLPRTPYRPFPEYLPPPGKGGLMLQMKSLPSSLALGEIPENAFWWVDAQFLPYNDAELVVTSTAYVPPLHGPWNAVKRVPRGRIIIYDTRFHPVKGSVLIRTESGVYPKVQPHPIGEAVTYAGSGEVRVDSFEEGQLFSRPRDMANRAQRFCAVSHNGCLVAVLSKARLCYYLEIMALEHRFINYQNALPCHKLSPGFEGGNHNDHVECKWSPDSSHLAISSSFGKLFLVNKRTMANVCEVFPDVVAGHLSSAGSFDFDPRVPYSTMAVGSEEGEVAVVRIDADGGCGTVLVQTDTDNTLDCVRYSQDGRLLAVSFRTFEVKVYDSLDLSQFHTIDMSELCPIHCPLYQGGNFPTVNRLSFSFDGRRLVTSSCDGIVRVWSLPRLLSLQEWCRKTILQHIPVVQVRQCDLPQKVKRFLLSEFF